MKGKKESRDWSGFDAISNKIIKADSFIGLIDSNENIAASWSFVSLLKHWNKKHSNTCFVPSKNRKSQEYIFSKQQYCYGNNIILGIGTDFSNARVRVRTNLISFYNSCQTLT
ncbi:MAG: MvaI/BcnI family restriction endonuclease [Parafilimonas sp.]